MPRGYTVDVDALHRFLFKQADRRGCLKLRQTQLALELGVTKFTMSRTIARMVKEERIRQITSGHYARGTFQIEDPAVWAAVHGGTD